MEAGPVESRKEPSLEERLKGYARTAADIARCARDGTRGLGEGFLLYSLVPWALPSVNRIVYHELLYTRSDWWNRLGPDGWTRPSDAEGEGVTWGGRLALLGDVAQCAAVAYAAWTIHPAIALVPIMTNTASMVYEALSPYGWAARGELCKSPLIPRRIGGGHFAFKSNWLLDDRDADRVTGSHFVPLIER